MYSAIEVAKFVISYCTEKGTPISNLKLQKILYYLQVYCMKSGYRLFREEIYAWQHGSVVPEVYYMFSGYGAAKIQNRYTTGIDMEVKDQLVKVIERLRILNPWELVRMTHVENGPWYKVFVQKIDPTGNIDTRLLVTDPTDLGV